MSNRTALLAPATGLARFGLGTAALARSTPEPAAFERVVTAALDAGLGYIDTAPMYECGAAETLVGASLARLGRRPTVSTKVGRLVRPLGATAPEDVPPEHFVRGGIRTVFDFSAEGIRTSYAESLDRLGMAGADIAFLHDPDEHWEQAAAEAMPALARLREEGAVSAVGVGMNQVAIVEQAVRRFDLDHVLVAGRYTLLDQSADEGLLELCAQRGTAVVAGGVFNSGLLASIDGTVDYRPATGAEIERVRALAKACRDFGVELKAAALQFPLRHPSVHRVLLGPETLDQLTDLIAAADTPIPDELWERFAGLGVRVPGI